MFPWLQQEWMHAFRSTLLNVLIVMCAAHLHTIKLHVHNIIIACMHNKTTYSQGCIQLVLVDTSTQQACNEPVHACIWNLQSLYKVVSNLELSYSLPTTW